jgi:hypothetical protein
VTDAGSGEPAATPGAADLLAAMDDLEDLRRLLLRASHGTAEPTEVKTALETYWRDNAGTLRSTATAVAEQVRVQLLDALYTWRDQIGRQLDAQRRDKN